MRIDLRTAALTDSEEQRVRIAARLLGAQRIEARLSPWDGTRCDVVVVNGDDAYGRQVMALAQKRRVGIVAYAAEAIAFDDAAHCRVTEGTAGSLVAALLGVIGAVREGSAPPSSSAKAGHAASGHAEDAAPLMQLAQDAWRGRDIDAVVAGRRISIRASLGRVLAASLSDMLAARDALSHHGGPGEFVLVPERHRGVGEVAWSLDAFLIDSALRGRSVLPPFVGTAYGLRDWPDLGSAQEALTPLRVARWLHQRSGCVLDRARLAGVATDEVNACLWAFRAGNLLVIGEPTPATPVAETRPGRATTPLLSKLAARFGLAW